MTAPTPTQIAGAPRKPLTGRHVLYAMVGFFGVIMAVNAAFLYFAVLSHPGLTTEDAYKKGLAYNETIDRAASQRQMGWRAKFKIAPDGAGPRALTLTIRDAKSRPVSGLAITAEFRRPADDDADLAVPFSESAPGIYVAQTDLPYHGNWNARITGRRDGKPIYRLDQRLWLK